MHGLREEELGRARAPQRLARVLPQYFLLLPLADGPELDGAGVDGLLLAPPELDGLLEPLELDGLLLPPAALELLVPFTAASHSWRLIEPSWLVSALLKSSELLEDALPPLAEDEPFAPPACFAAASNSCLLSFPSWFVSAFSKVGAPELEDEDDELEPPAAEDEDGLLPIEDDELPPDDAAAPPDDVEFVLLLESAAYAKLPAKARSEKATSDRLQSVITVSPLFQ